MEINSNPIFKSLYRTRDSIGILFLSIILGLISFIVFDNVLWDWILSTVFIIAGIFVILWFILYRVIVFDNKLEVSYLLFRKSRIFHSEEIAEIRYVSNVMSRAAAGFRVFVKAPKGIREIKFECMNSKTAEQILNCYKSNGVSTSKDVSFRKTTV